MTTQKNPSIRQAIRQDAYDLARLIDIAGEGIPAWLWARNCADRQTPLEFGAEKARMSLGGFSYLNAQVAMLQGEVAGMVLSYPIDSAPEDDPASLPEPIAPFVELEAQSVGTWYINALAVYPGKRGDGIGTALLKHVECLALVAGSHSVSIQVYGQNAGAVRLYQSLGYELVAKAAVQLHPCQPYYTGDVLLLIKDLTH